MILDMFFPIANCVEWIWWSKQHDWRWTVAYLGLVFLCVSNISANWRQKFWLAIGVWCLLLSQVDGVLYHVLRVIPETGNFSVFRQKIILLGSTSSDLN